MKDFPISVSLIRFLQDFHSYTGIDSSSEDATWLSRFMNNYGKCIENMSIWNIFVIITCCTVNACFPAYPGSWCTVCIICHMPLSVLTASIWVPLHKKRENSFSITWAQSFLCRLSYCTIVEKKVTKSNVAKMDFTPTLVHPKS